MRWGLGRMPVVLGMILESPRDTRTQVCISPGAFHCMWAGRPLVDTTWTTVSKPHFKAKATEVWRPAEIGAKAYSQRRASW